MAVEVARAGLADGVGAWFTGRDPGGHASLGRAGNLSHHRPHLPTELARARGEVAEHIGWPVDAWHFMRQVHGAQVAVIDATTPPGAQLDGVDAMVTTEVGRPLVVQVADCVPVLLAGRHTIGAVHAGRRGVLAGVVDAAIDAMTGLEQDRGPGGGSVRAVIGPSIRGCCYELPEGMRDAFVERLPSAAASTTWSTPSVDLGTAVVAQLDARGVTVVDRFTECTRCDPEQRWFSHRADPDTGRFAGIVVRGVNGASE